ncbi:hypothetical protein BD324DRAFT_649539 [Kockovaella imperatae]|uniref:Uncharacterized protein n=1 Tax=Kockovaella imperatae TaxID=4999 RepID=A0A1Y1UKU2_9TREE|nr:hypothetical protein BD324DRAFT_649539 [Kockovaella imperatae]ORX38157.1 hypothetical protein BD324DRAFT_649539 [Kockovaella imperatae]
MRGSMWTPAKLIALFSVIGRLSSATNLSGLCSGNQDSWPNYYGPHFIYGGWTPPNNVLGFGECGILAPLKCGTAGFQPQTPPQTGQFGPVYGDNGKMVQAASTASARRSHAPATRLRCLSITTSPFPEAQDLDTIWNASAAFTYQEHHLTPHHIIPVTAPAPLVSLSWMSTPIGTIAGTDIILRIANAGLARKSGCTSPIKGAFHLQTTSVCQIVRQTLCSILMEGLVLNASVPPTFGVRATIANNVLLAVVKHRRQAAYADQERFFSQLRIACSSVRPLM